MCCHQPVARLNEFQTNHWNLCSRNTFQLHRSNAHNEMPLFSRMRWLFSSYFCINLAKLFICLDDSFLFAPAFFFPFSVVPFRSLCAWCCCYVFFIRLKMSLSVVFEVEMPLLPTFIKCLTLNFLSRPKLISRCRPTFLHNFRFSASRPK